MNTCKNCGTELGPMTLGNDKTSVVVMSCPKGCDILAFGSDSLFEIVEKHRLTSCPECDQPVHPQDLCCGKCVNNVLEPLETALKEIRSRLNMPGDLGSIAMQIHRIIDNVLNKVPG